MTRTGRHALRATAAVLALPALVLLTGCAGMSARRAAASGAPVQALDELVSTPARGASGSLFPQHWQAETLVVDLRGITGSGSLVLQPRAGAHWPARLAFQVTPRELRTLEVQGERHAVLRVRARGAQPVELTLGSGVYSQHTQRLVVRWVAPRYSTAR